MIALTRLRPSPSRSTALLLAVAAGLEADGLAAQAELERVTVQNPEGAGVLSEIFLIPPAFDDSERRLGVTDENGVLVLQRPMSVAVGHRIYALPNNVGEYYQSERTDVMHSNVTLTLRYRDHWDFDDDTQYVVNLAATTTDWPSRLWLHNEISIAARSYDEDLAGDSEQLVYAIAGEALNIDMPFYYDSFQEKYVASSHLVDAVADFQRLHELTPDGILGYETLATLAGQDYFEVRYGVPRPQQVDTPVLPLDFLHRVEDLADVELFTLATNAMHAKGSGREPGLVALLFSEVATRLRDEEPTGSSWLATAAELEVYRALGQRFSVEGTDFDPVQNRFVMTSELVRILHGFQAANGLPSTGAGNYATLRALAAGQDVGPFLTAVRIPPP